MAWVAWTTPVPPAMRMATPKASAISSRMAPASSASYVVCHAVVAAQGNTDCERDQFFGFRVEGAGLHSRFVKPQKGRITEGWADARR